MNRSVTGRRLLFFSGLGLVAAATWVAVSGAGANLAHALTPGQRAETILQLLAGAGGALTLLTCFWRRGWARGARLAWGITLSAAAGMSALVWGPPFPGQALAFAGGAGLIAWLASVMLRRGLETGSDEPGARSTHAPRVRSVGPFSLWRGDVRLGEVVPLPNGEIPTAQHGNGRLLLDAPVPDLGGSMQMRSVRGGNTHVSQFPIDPVDFDALEARAEGRQKSTVSVRGRPLTAREAAPMRSEFILTVRDAAGQVIDSDAVQLERVRWPEGLAKATGLEREQWLVMWTTEGSGPR